ncbi:MAG: hypothetical protein R3190_08385 [Thermoanaerobaculia bacterium]|nr:hypothetical protein [Thermoanaerobaculia bacterium]
MSLLLASRRVVMGGGGEPRRVEPAIVAVEGARVADLRTLEGEDYEGAVAAAGAASPEAELRDFGDRLLTPAFVNAHTHLALGFLRGAPPPDALRGNMVRQFYFGIESRLGPGDVEAFSRMGAYESLLQGVGLVWDHYYHGVAVARALVATGLAGVVAPTLQDLDGPGVAACDAQLEATEEIAGSDYFAARGVFATWFDRQSFNAGTRQTIWLG